MGLRLILKYIAIRQVCIVTGQAAWRLEARVGRPLSCTHGGFLFVAWLDSKAAMQIKIHCPTRIYRQPNPDYKRDLRGTDPKKKQQKK